MHYLLNLLENGRFKLRIHLCISTLQLDQSSYEIVLDLVLAHGLRAVVTG